MPVKFRVSLVPQKPLPASELYPDRLHALFFSLLSKDLAESLHSQSRVKPFSLNFLVLSEGKRKPLFVCDSEEVEGIVLEVSFLEDSLFPKFLSSYLLEDKELKLGEFKLRKLIKPDVRDRELLTYENIYESAPPSERIVLSFLTPTTFRRGVLDHPLPEPELIFKGLIRKWQRFSNLKIDVDLRDTVSKKLAVAGAWVRTRRVNLSAFGWTVGFTGKVILHAKVREEGILKWLNALARFGEFAGIGRKTTMGFGMVRLEEGELGETFPPQSP